MRWIIVIAFVVNGLVINAQQITLDSSFAYVGKQVTVYGRVTEATFNYNRKRDTCTLKLHDEGSDKLILIKILPEARAGFGYRPEDALLHKLAYFSGNLQMNKGALEMYISSPFSISLKKGEAMSEPAAIVSPPQSRAGTTAKNTAVLESQKAQPAPQLKQIKPVKESKKEKVLDQPKIAKPSEQKKEKKPEKADQREIVTKEVLNTTTTEEKFADSKKNKAVAQNMTAPASPSNPSEQNPNHLSAAPVKHKDSLVGTEIILTSRINLRGGPGSYFTTIGSINKGEIVKILSCSFEWCKVIEVKVGKLILVQGYVKADKLK
jgi:hypothetical protein